jgi:hypothetical protein
VQVYCTMSSNTRVEVGECVVKGSSDAMPHDTREAQRGPSYPLPVQTQEKLFTKSTQEPLKHGATAHSLVSVSQKTPSYPLLQTHSKSDAAELEISEPESLLSTFSLYDEEIERREVDGGRTRRRGVVVD